eukprot:GFUD01116480.1.p1 GENE.GFUD01116480.1~~GFUD01116480.1.p1  ORF type:complete len:101 (+),score=24.26 GFUD01116480.1:201-503(+)
MCLTGEERVTVFTVKVTAAAVVKHAGGTSVFISLKPTKEEEVISSGEWKLDLEELNNVFTSKTKAIIFNNPNNPLGQVFSAEEIFLHPYRRPWPGGSRRR